MKIITKNYWGNNYEFPVHKMVESVIFPPEWNEQQRLEMLDCVYSKTHRIEKSERDADRYNLSPIPVNVNRKIADSIDVAVITANYYNSLKNSNAHH